MDDSYPSGSEINLVHNLKALHQAEQDLILLYQYFSDHPSVARALASLTASIQIELLRYATEELKTLGYM